jgi:hypothetical protein
VTTIDKEGTETFVFPGPNMYITEDVSYGLNLYDAQGWATLEGGVMDLPAQLVPGTSATTMSTFTLPAAGMAEGMSFTFNPNAEIYADRTWIDVETLIR